MIVDVDPRTLTIDAAACAAAVSPRTRAVVPVHLYGQPADMTRRCWRVADAPRAGGGRGLLPGAPGHRAPACRSGTAGAAGAFSFYPTKNLGALGDGGAVVTNDAALADRVRRLRNGGQAGRYDHVEPGVNSRLDELQAAVLRVRLPGLAGATAVRRDLAADVSRGASAPGVTPIVERDPGHVYHLFPVRIARTRYAAWRSWRERGIETLVHYPVPLSAQPAFARYDPRACPVAGLAAAELLSLPLNPRLSREDVTRVADAVNEFSRKDAVTREGTHHRRSRVHRIAPGGTRSWRRATRRMVLDNLSTGSIENIAHLKGRAGFAYTIDSVTNEPLLAELIDQSDVVFHLAAAVGVKLIVEQPVHTIETNVHGTEVVLKHANKKKKLVFIASTSEVYGKSADVPFREGADLVLGATVRHRWAYACSKLHRRVPGAGVLEGEEAAGRGRAALQHRGPAPDRTVRDGAADLRAPGAGAASRSPCSATARSRAASPTSPTWWTR